MKPVGWRYDSWRHSLAARGVRSYNAVIKGKNFPAQLSVGKTKVDEVEFKRPFKDFMNKPEGGLWTSSATPHIIDGGDKVRLASDWVGWTDLNNFKRPGSNKGVLVRPINTAKIFRVDDVRDVRFLRDAYGGGVTNGVSAGIDWTEMSKDFDAVSLSDRGNRQLHSMYGLGGEDKELNMHVWDAESTHWFKPAFKKEEPVSIVHDFNSPVDAFGRLFYVDEEGVHDDYAAYPSTIKRVEDHPAERTSVDLPEGWFARKQHARRTRLK